MKEERLFTLRNDVGILNVVKVIKALAFDVHPWDVIIRKHRKQRTPPQNSLLWEWYTIIGNEIGYDKAEMHDILREKFLPWHEIEVLGVKRKILTSTSDPDFTTVMMTEYMNHIDRFAATELGIRLPHPQDKQIDEDASRYGKYS